MWPWDDFDDDFDSSLPLWGKILNLKSIYFIEEGEVASLDGIIGSIKLIRKYQQLYSS